ncbi:MAG: hypothetical protein HYR72_23420 [Deltaproteobacteria bacterium]|nr:hypothetical protein [Deltaproteobacteria bacterium]MBI3389050.1 hypothetical protein [Deltaproteobacteria bacterium]
MSTAIALGASAAHAAVSINVGNASGAPGDLVPFSVTLTADGGEQVLGTQNELGLDAAGVHFAAKVNKKPNCAVNPAIFKSLSGFAFLNSCDPTAGACTGIRAIVAPGLVDEDVALIPTGSVLYTCMIQIATDAAGGTSPITIDHVRASDPNGVVIEGVTGNPGSVTVVVPATATPTPSETLTPLPTNTAPPTNTLPPTVTKPPATHTAIPTVTNTRGSGGGDDDGCQISATHHSNTGWLVMLPAAAFLWFRRRSR